MKIALVFASRRRRIPPENEGVIKFNLKVSRVAKWMIPYRQIPEISVAFFNAQRTLEELIK